jgi:chromosome segregation ATPase
MAGLKVEANLENTIENIVALREEIDRLKKSLIEVAGVPNSDKAVKKLEAQLQKAMKSLREYQSKYSQLKKAYDDVIGSEETIKKVHEETKGLQSTNQWIVANTKAVKEADAEIKKLKNNFKGLTDEEKTGEKGYGILRQVEYQVAVRKKEEEAIRRTIKAQKEQIIQSESEEGSITSLRKQLNQLIITYDNIGRANRNGGVGKDLLTQIKAVQTELNAAEQATGRFQRNVGNYSSAFNGLGMSIQQIARELPSATMGINMFFLAISNNLPIFFDEVQKARKEYAAYLAELSKGNKDIQKVAPVWKQLAAGIFSWNTALVVGITLLTAYGKEIFDYIGGLFSAKSALLDLLTAEQEMALARKEAVKSTAKERVELDILYNKLKNVSLSAKERTAAINEWLHKYPQYANILENEKVNLGNLESAYRTLSKEIYANAVARNYADKMADLSVKKEKEEMKRLVQKATLMKAEAQVELAEKEQEAALQARRQGLYGSGNRVSVANDNLSAANKNLEKQQKIYDDIVKNVKTYDDNLVAISNHINTLDLFPQPQQGTYEYWTQQKQRAESVLKEIKSDVKRTLDDAFKKGADFSSLEVDEAVIETYVKAVNEIKEAERELKAYDSTSKQEDTDEKLIKQQEDIRSKNEKILSLETKYAIERQRQQQDLDNQLEQSRIDSLQDGYEKEQAQRELNNKKEIQALERQKEDYIRAYIQGQKEIFDAQEELKAKQTKGYVRQTFDASTVNVKDITSAWDKIIKNTQIGQGVDEWQKRENAMNEYLIEYGTFSQKKAAIDKKYEDAINKETDLGTKNTLQKQWEEAISSLNMSKLKEEINWEMVFGDLSKITKEQLTKIKAQLQEFKDSDDFKDATPEQIQVIEGAINSINSAMVDKGGIFGGMTESLKELANATEELKKAEEELVRANNEGTEAEKEEAQRKVNKAQQRKQNAETDVTRSSKKTIDNLIMVGDAIAQLGSNAEMSLSSFGNAAASVVDAFTEAGSKIGGIVGAIFSILEGIQKQGLAGFVGNIVGNVAGAVGGIFDTLTFGAFGLGGADYSRYNEMVEEYNKLNEIWDELIDKKREYIDMSYGVEADKVGQEAIDLVEKQIEAYRTLGKERLNSGASVGSHSIGKRMAKNTSSSDWQDIANALDMSVNAAKEFIGTGRMTGLFDLTVEQLEKLKSDAPTFWADMDDDVREYLDSIIEGEAKIEEIQNQVKEQLTQTTFDSVFDSFVDTLMDMDSSAKDFAEDFSEYMQRAILTNMVGEKFSKELQDWYDSFAEAGKDKEGITKGEMEELRKQYEEIVDAAVAERNKLAEIFGWTGEATQQSASSKGFQSMSQDTGEELNGRFTALQIAGEEIKNQNIAQSQSLSILNTRIDTISSTSSNIRDIASETRDIIASSYLELVQISENTGAIVKPVQQMQKDIAEVKKNTSKL